MTDHDYYGVVLDREEIYVDNSDISLAILESREGVDLRVAQLGLQINGDEFLLSNLQGSGPEKKFQRMGIDKKEVIKKFQDRIRLKALNTLVCVVCIYAQENDVASVGISPDKKSVRLNPDATLYACAFRREEGGLILRPQLISKDMILNRTVGSSEIKGKNFEEIYIQFANMLRKKIN
jgi:hypothetical protein